MTVLETPAGPLTVMRGGLDDAATIVYLHSSAGETTNGLLEDLGADHSLVVPVFPGFPGSDRLTTPVDDMEDAVFCLLDVLDTSGLRAPVVIGQSFGGWLAAELATRAPERVGALVLVSPLGLRIEGAPVADLFGRSPADLAGDFYADAEHPDARLMRAFGNMLDDPTTMGALPAPVLVPLAQSMAAVARVAWNPYLHNPKLARRLRRVTAPTLVVAGALDRFTPRAHAEAYVAGIPGARLAVIADAAHMVAAERPAAVAAEVRAFLAPLGAGTAPG